MPAATWTRTAAYVMPMHVDVNDQAALIVDVLAVDPRRPYVLCAGIVTASARHPTDEELSFDVQLLAARLGGPQRASLQPK